MTSHKFDKQYFEDGIKSGISCYENYRYIPERSAKEAKSLSKIFPGKSILDFGCSKGFLVKAISDTGIKAFGFDISEYAIQNCHADISNYISNNNIRLADVIFCKDVLEHLTEGELDNVLAIFSLFKECFIIVPFGDNDKYRIEEYHKDTTHILAKNEWWWEEKFRENDLIVVNFDYRLDGFKEKWYDVHNKGNGFYHLRKNERSYSNNAAQ